MAHAYIKDAMANALKDLSKRKSIQKITISDIVSECGISKQSFYNHFKDKNDLIVYTCTSEARRNLKDAMKEGRNYKEAIMHYYKNSLPLKHFYRSFIHEPDLQILLFNLVAEFSREYMVKQIEYHYGKGKITPELNLVIRFISSGNAQLFIDWMMRNMETDPEIMADVNFACIPEPLKNYFNCEEINAII